MDWEAFSFGAVCMLVILIVMMMCGMWFGSHNGIPEQIAFSEHNCNLTSTHNYTNHIIEEYNCIQIITILPTYD